MRAKKLHLSPSELHYRLLGRAELKLSYRGQPFKPWRRKLRRKLTELLGRVPEKKCRLNIRELERVETYDFHYRIDQPIRVTAETEDVLFVLRKR